MSAACACVYEDAHDCAESRGECLCSDGDEWDVVCWGECDCRCHHEEWVECFLCRGTGGLLEACGFCDGEGIVFMDELMRISA